MSRPGKLTDKDRADILALKGQVTAPGVAEKFGIAQTTVYAIWQERYVATGLPKKKLTPELRDEIITLKAGGMRTRDVMAATGFGECTILLVIREARAEGDPRVTKAAPPPRKQDPIIIPARMVVRISKHAARMRDSFKARGMSHEDATREALRIAAGSAVEGRGASRAAGEGECLSLSPFHAPTMEETRQ